METTNTNKRQAYHAMYEYWTATVDRLGKDEATKKFKKYAVVYYSKLWVQWVHTTYKEFPKFVSNREVDIEKGVFKIEFGRNGGFMMLDF